MGPRVALDQDLLLDTHAFVWLQFRTLKASAEDLATLAKAAERNRWFLSAFSFFEMAHAFQRNRLQLDKDLSEWLRLAMVHPAPTIIGITPEIAAATAQLPEEFHGDPGDRILAATAIIHNLTVVTHDDLMLRFGKQRLFRTLKVNELKEPK